MFVLKETGYFFGCSIFHDVQSSKAVARTPPFFLCRNLFFSYIVLFIFRIVQETIMEKINRHRNTRKTKSLVVSWSVPGLIAAPLKGTVSCL